MPSPPRKSEATATATAGMARAAACGQHRNSLSPDYQLDHGHSEQPAGSHYSVLSQNSTVPPNPPHPFSLYPARDYALPAGYPSNGLHLTALPTLSISTVNPGEQCTTPFDPRTHPQLEMQQCDPADPYGASHSQPFDRGGVPAAYQRSRSVDWSARDVILESRAFPRQRSAKACETCRKRKTRCSGEKPCVRCVERGLECVFDDAPTLRGRRALARTANHDRAAARRASLDANLVSRSPKIGHKKSSRGGLDEINDPPAVMPSTPGSLDSPGGVDHDTFHAPRDTTSAPDSPGTPASEPTYPQFAHGSLAGSPILPNSPSIHGYGAFEESDPTSPPPTGLPYPYVAHHASGLPPDVSSISSSASSSPVTWPAPLDHGAGRAVPPIPVASFSSSSLRDALTPRPRRAPALQSSPRVPHNAPSDPSRTLSSMLRQTSIADPAGTSRERLPAESSSHALRAAEQPRFDHAGR